MVGYDEAGNPKTKNVLAKTKKACVEKLEKLKEQCGDSRPVQVRPEMRFGDWMDYWYQNFSKPRLRPTTQLGYEGWIYNHLIPGLGSIQLNRLTQADLQQFFRTMKESGRKSNVQKRGKGMADRSVRSCHAVCQMALDRAVEEKLIHGNPAAGCRLPPIKGREMQVLTQEEMRRFLIQAKAANRTISLPPAMLEVLAEYKKGIFSDLMFPSRIKPDQPIDPGYVRKRLQVILKRAGCKSVRFHDLRHTFATMSLENGMDVKTLSTIIGHVSSATTLNTYTHITDEMRRRAAVNIDQGIAGVEAAAAREKEKTVRSEPEFTPVQPARRRPGTGYLKQIGENLWEGRYSPIWPDGKKHSRNVYGHTEAECEEKLKELILQMKAEIAALRSGETTEYPDGVSPKKKAIAAYLREHPSVTSKGMIARELGMDRSTVQRYYDAIRAELLGEN